MKSNNGRHLKIPVIYMFSNLFCNILIRICYMLGVYFVFFLQYTYATTIGMVSAPVIWNMSNLEMIKNDTSYYLTKKSIVEIADKFCKLKPVVVTDKKNCFTSDKHYYCSVATYYWKADGDSTKYVKRDGLKNPIVKEYDLARLSELTKRCKYLSTAFYLTGDTIYFNFFLKQIRAWFVDENTYMYPNFKYAAVILGDSVHRGRCSGLIESYSFNDILDSIRLVNSVMLIDDNTMLSLQQWFKSFVEWVKTGEFGDDIDKLKNNIGLAYDVTLTNIFMFIGEFEAVRGVVRLFSDKWLYRHITVFGEQPLELKRSNGFSYSVYNLSHILDFCLLTNKVNTNYYGIHHDRIDAAFSYLFQYVKNPSDFPYSQISGWKDAINKFNIQLQRRNRIAGNGSTILNIKEGIVPLNLLLL